MALILHLLVVWAAVTGAFVGLAFFLPGFQIGARGPARRVADTGRPAIGGPALARALAATGSATPPPRVAKQGTWRAFALAAVSFGAANVVLGWVLGFVLKILIFLPNLLTLGLLGLLVPVVVNAFLLKVIDTKFGEAVEIEGLKPLLTAATVISVVGFVAGKIV